MNRFPSSRRLTPLHFFTKFAVVLAGAAALASSQAATQYWDADASGAVGFPPTAGTGGTGTWNNSSALWWNGSSYTAWNGDAAGFINYTGASSAITIAASTTVQATALNFSGNGVAMSVVSAAGGVLNLTGSATISQTSANAPVVSATLTGVNGLTKTGTGLLHLRGNNIGLTGGVFVNQGRIQTFTSTNALGAGDVTVAAGASVNMGIGAGNNFFITGTGDGTGALRAGVQTATGTITISGTSRITGGTLTGQITGSGELEIGSVNNTNATAATTLSNGSNNYAGGTTIYGMNNGGTVADTVVTINAANGALSNGATAGNILMTTSGTNRAVINLNGNNETINGLNSGGTGQAAILNNGGAASVSTLTVGDNNANGNFAGVIANGTTGGQVAVTKIGTGVQILSGTNTYTEATTINAGTLLVNGTLSSSSAVTVNNTGVLGGNGTAAGTVTVNSGGTLSAGSSIGTLATGALSIDGGTFALELNTSTTSTDLINAAGALSLTSGAVLTLTDLGSNVALADGTVFTFLTYAGSWNGGFFTYNATTLTDDASFAFGANTYQISYNGVDGLSNAVTLEVVPEPSVVAMFTIGGLGLVWHLRRRKLVA